MKTKRLMCVAIAIIGALSIHVAHALQATTWINLASLSVQIVDLNSTDELAPGFALANYQSGVGVLQQGASPLYISTHSSSDWITGIGLTYPSSPPGATASATFDGGSRVAAASVIGSVDGDKVNGGTSNRASFVLSAWTQVTLAFDGRVTMVGADPNDSSHEAYAIIQSYLQDGTSSEVLALDDLRAEAWMGDQDTFKTFSLTLANNGSGIVGGWLDIGGLAQTISKVQPTTVPEPATFVLCLAAFGLLGAVRRGAGA